MRLQKDLRSYLDTDVQLLSATNMNLLSHSGKQLRPLLSILVSRALSGGKRIGDDSIKVAIAAELIHNASLLHDDVVDEADTRRSNPTLRVLMGPTASVLVGDFWMARAVKTLLDCKQNCEKYVRIFGKTLSDLSEGEIFQLQKTFTCDTDYNEYLQIIFKKTASLFVSTARSAAISVGASADIVETASEFGKQLGYAFQMRDDMFDYMTSCEAGKPVGVDVMEQKITLPLLGAFSNTCKEKEQEIRESIRNITKEAGDGIIDFVRNNGGLEYSEAKVAETLALARKQLALFPDSKEKELLGRLTDFFAVRKK